MDDDEIKLCERCNYDEAVPEAWVAENFQDRYQALCLACEKALYAAQAKMADWGEY